MAPGAEEAALRAKIQAMKNLLEVKKRGQGTRSPPGAGYNRGGASHRPWWAANRSWSAPPAAAYYHKPAGSASANKVWTREGVTSSSSEILATSGSSARLAARVAMPKPWKQSVRNPLRIWGIALCLLDRGVLTGERIVAAVVVIEWRVAQGHRQNLRESHARQVRAVVAPTCG